MTKEKTDFTTDWYSLWMQQSKDFFESANENLKTFFDQGKPFNPEENMKIVQEWMDKVKEQWQVIPLNEQQRAYEPYWMWMTKMCNDAMDRMVQEWINRSRENNPVDNIRDLYEMWLKSCRDVFDHAMRSKNYQQAYGDMMNAALKFWQTSVPKK